MSVIRIEIGIMPPLLRSIVRSALESQGDFSIVDHSPNDPATRLDAIDVVVVSAEHEKFGRIPLTSLMREDSPRIVAIAADGHSSALIRVTTENSPIAAASDLSDVVRRAALDRRKAIH